MNRHVFATLISLLFMLLIGSCGDDEKGSSGIDPGPSGYGPGPEQGSAEASDLRGKFLIDEHTVTDEDCSSLTPESDSLVGKKFYLSILQEGTKLNATAEAAEIEPDEPPPEPMHFSGTASGDNYSVRDPISENQSFSEQGVTYTIRVSGNVDMDGSINGDEIQGSMDMNLTVTINVSGYGSQTETCHIKSAFSGDRVESPREEQPQDLVVAPSGAGEDRRSSVPGRDVSHISTEMLASSESVTFDTTFLKSLIQFR